MNLKDAIKTLKEHGYVNVLTHTDTIQKHAVEVIKRKLDPEELKQVIEYLETVSNPDLGLNTITINYAIRHVAERHFGVPAVKKFFDRLKDHGITEIFESEHGLNGFLIQYFKLVKINGTALDIIIITRADDVFYVYHSGNSQSIESRIEEVLNAKWYEQT